MAGWQLLLSAPFILWNAQQNYCIVFTFVTQWECCSHYTVYKPCPPSSSEHAHLLPSPSQCRHYSQHAVVWVCVARANVHSLHALILLSFLWYAGVMPAIWSHTPYLGGGLAYSFSTPALPALYSAASLRGVVCTRSCL